MRAVTIPYLTGSLDRFRRLAKIAEPASVRLQPVVTLSELEALLRSHETSVVITDSELSDGTWRDVIELCKLQAPDARLLVTSRTDSASLWAEVAEAGAFDLLAQPFYAPEVRRCLRAILEAQSQEQLAEATI